LIVGRYALCDEIAAGGMATVHFGRLLGPAGFSRTVAIKRLHPQFARDPEFVAMFLDEARIAARIRHPNVVPTLDVVAAEGELFLVMDYVEGESLARLERAAFRTGPLVPALVVAILGDALRGVHAAHEATDEQGAPLSIVHRDLTPHNILVGVDGIARVLDFGVAKAVGRSHSTRSGEVKGKVPYMAPEQLRGSVTRRTDIYAAAVVAWEALTGQRLFKGDSDGEIMFKIMDGNVQRPSAIVEGLPPALDDVVLRGLARDPEARFATAADMAAALEAAVAPARPSEVAAWARTLAGGVLSQRAEQIARIERSSPRALDVTPASVPVPGSNPSAAAQTGAGDVSQRVSSTLPAVQVDRTDKASEALPAAAPTSRAAARILAISLGGICLIGALGVGVLLGKRTTGAQPADDRAQSAAAPPPASATAYAPPPVPAAPAPSAETMASAAPAATASSPVAAAPLRAGTAKPPATADAKPSKASKASCNPPYTVDAKGVKRYKLECL
jgi:serine/threonine-protein kinase